MFRAFVTSIAAISFLQGCEPDLNRGSDLSKGDAAYSGGSYKEAISYYAQVPKSSEDYPKAIERLGSIYFEEGEKAFQAKEYQNALNSYLRVAQGTPSYEAAAHRMAEVRALLDRAAFEKAKEANSTRALTIFIAEHPGSSLLVEAEALIKKRRPRQVRTLKDLENSEFCLRAYCNSRDTYHLVSGGNNTTYKVNLYDTIFEAWTPDNSDVIRGIGFNFFSRSTSLMTSDYEALAILLRELEPAGDVQRTIAQIRTKVSEPVSQIDQAQAIPFGHFVIRAGMVGNPVVSIRMRP